MQGTVCDVREGKDVKALVAFASDKLNYIDIWVFKSSISFCSYYHHKIGALQILWFIFHIREHRGCMYCMHLCVDTRVYTYIVFLMNTLLHVMFI